MSACALCTDHRRVYATVVGREDHLERIDGGGFSLDEFNSFPERYKSTFATKVWHCGLLLSGVAFVFKMSPCVHIPVNHVWVF